jgi:hypothetical protein
MSSTYYLTSCPDGDIPDDSLESWTQLETTMATEFQNTKTKPSHLAMALRLLRSTLVEMYNKACIEELINNSLYAGECDRFSAAVCKCIAANKWSRGTAYKILALMKKVLFKTTIPESFVQRITFKGPSKNDNRVIGKYGKLPPDAPSRVLLESWATQTKRHSLSVQSKCQKHHQFHRRFVIGTARTLG